MKQEKGTDGEVGEGAKHGEIIILLGNREDCKNDQAYDLRKMVETAH